MRPKFNHIFLELPSKVKNQSTVLPADFHLNPLNFNKNLEAYLFLEYIFANNFLSQITLSTRITKNSVKLFNSVLIKKKKAGQHAVNLQHQSQSFSIFFIAEDLLDESTYGY